MAGISSLTDLGSSKVRLVGGKAASLAAMLRVGLPVPLGFVITTKAYVGGMTPELSKKILAAFDELGVQRVAVRSSAVAEDSAKASWAGQLDTYLNTTRSGLIGAVKNCWASINSEHAREYANQNNVPKADRAVAVIVQAMVDSELSGVLFTANPVTENRDEVVIEAAYGLGELLVQGMVTPENIIAEKATRNILHRQPSKQRTMLVYKNGKNQEVPVPPSLEGRPVMTAGQVKQLVKLAHTIEQHYGSPQDIEWAIAGNQLYILQSRPITTLGDVSQTPKFTFEKTFTREESLIVSEIQHREFVTWLAQITTDAIPPLMCRINNGLLETWLCQEWTTLVFDDIYRHNSQGKAYLQANIKSYKDLVGRMHEYEERKFAHSLDELKEYLALFAQIMTPLHVIFFTPIREDTPKPLFDLALKVRGEDAVFDTSDLYIRDSLTHIYPDCDGIETFIGLQDLDKPVIAKLKTRENDFIWFEGQYLNIDFSEFRKAHPEYGFKVDEIDREQKFIEGSVAYPGLVEGEAQVILRKKEVANFKEGNVLVAPMTSPHYLPAMRKAIAFVTDEGGVTCHAAIVAREMKKPCIIGTKHATAVINEGDLIEVDATSGVVRIIKEKVTPKLAKQPKAPPGVKYALTVPQSVLFAELSLRACLRPIIQAALGIDYEPEYIAIDAGGAMRWNYDNDQAFNAAMTSDRSVEAALSNFVNAMAATARKLERRSSLASSHTRRAHNRDDILQDLQEYWQAYILHMSTLFSFWNVESLIAQAITDELRQAGHETAIQGLDQFIKSNETNQFVRERACFEKIVRRFAGERQAITEKTASPELSAALRHHAREFSFLLTPFNLGKAPSATSLLPRVVEVQKNLSKGSHSEIESAVPDLGASLAPNLKQLVHILQQLTFWKNERIDVMSMADAKMELLYQAAANSLDLSVDELFSLTSREIEQSLQSGDLAVSRAVLADRAVAYCLILHKGEIAFYQPSQAGESETSSQHQQTDWLQGLGSSSGITRGKVRLLLSIEEAEQLKAGEVLVTTMTRPEMGSALDRAAAFVTDEGGLLCHAAIISREMKKPCIIATGNATKVLKNGDLVEVDGSQGTVRIISAD